MKNLEIALVRSHTLKANFGINSITPDLLEVIAKELIEPEDTIEYDYIDSLPKDVFRSWFTRHPKQNENCGVDYWILFNANHGIMRHWFCFSHEVAHLALHKDDISKAIKDQRNGIEIEADLLAQLFFWPIISLFPPTGKNRSEEEIGKTLYKYMIERMIRGRIFSRIQEKANWIPKGITLSIATIAIKFNCRFYREWIINKLLTRETIEMNCNEFCNKLQHHLPNVWTSMLEGKEINF